MNFRPILLTIAVATAATLPAFLTGGLAVQLREEMDFGAAALGLAVAAFFTASSLASALFGRAVERIGSHRGMRLAAVCSAASLLAIAAFARSWETLVLFLVLGGFANAVAHPATHLSLAREVPPERQGLSFGIKQSAIPTSTLIAGLAVPTIAVTFGWRWAFVGAAALALLVALLVPANTEEPVQKLAEARKGDARSWSLIMLAVGVGLGSMASTPLGAFIVGSAVESGMRVEAAGLLLAFGSAFGILMRILFGYLADGMQSGRLLLVAGMLAFGIGGFVMLASGTSALLVAGTLLAFGAGWGWQGLFNFAVVKSNPGAPAAATGITQTGASGGAASGPLLFGIVAQHASYSVAWLVSGGLALGALIAVLIGRRMVLRDRSVASRKT